MIELSISKYFLCRFYKKRDKNLFDFQVGAPQYLSVPSFRNCLGDHPSPTGIYSELCLPVVKPQNCTGESWESIQDPEIFSGVRCALDHRNSFGAPEYLSLFQFQDCLSTKDTQVSFFYVFNWHTWLRLWVYSQAETIIAAVDSWEITRHFY